MPFSSNPLGPLQEEAHPGAIADKCLTTWLSHKRENVLGCGLLCEVKVKTHLSSTKNAPNHFCTEKSLPLCERTEHIWISQARTIRDSWWWRKQRRLGDSFVFPVCTTFFLTLCQPVAPFPPSLTPSYDLAHQCDTHSQSTYITKDT